MPQNPTLTGQELIWQKVRGVSRAREIVIDGETWVRIRRMKMFGSLARVDSKSGSWTFKRAGFFRTRITIRLADTETSVGVFTPAFSWFGMAGVLELEGGVTYRWEATKSLGREHSFFDGQRMPLIRFRGGPRKCRMRFEEPANDPWLPPLAALGYYMIQLKSDDDAAGIAAAAAAG